MSEWKEFKLGELCEITSSRRIFLNEYVSCGVPFYRSKEIIEKAKGNEISTELFITLERFNEIKSKNNVPVENDILITSVGTLGVSYLVSKSDFFYFKDGNLTWLRNYTNHIYPKYLLHWLRSNIAKERFQEISIGSTQAALTIQGLKGIKIKIPEYSHQVNIAEILSSLDDKIELNNKTNQELESLAQLLFKRWFVDFEFPNENGEPYKSSGGEMVDSELGKIPKEFRVFQIGQFSNVIDCLHSKKPEISKTPSGFLYLQLSNIQDNGLLDLTDRNWISEPDYKKWTSRIEVREGDFVITNVGRSGAVSRITRGVKAAIGRNMTAIRLYNDFQYFGFFTFLLLSDFMKKEIESKLDSGTILDALNVRSIPKLRFICDSDFLLVKKFEKAAESIWGKIEANKIENYSLISLRDTLLPKLISGELQINEN